MRIPKHIAIIMDGNGRWAKHRGLPRMEGHRAGSKVAIDIIRYCAKKPVRQLTLYTLSEENWKRPTEEIDALMRLLKVALMENRKLLIENDLRFSVIGNRINIPQDVLDEIDESVRVTADNKGMMLCLAINYGARSEIVNSVKQITSAAVAEKWTEDDIEKRINQELVSNNMYTAGMPDPDLLIRTAGEMRLSNFLLWQLHYTEMWVTNVCWPDFIPLLLDEAIHDYSERHRKFGGLDAI